jgi:hypothetical protein
MRTVSHPPSRARGWRRLVFGLTRPLPAVLRLDSFAALSGPLGPALARPVHLGQRSRTAPSAHSGARVRAAQCRAVAAPIVGCVASTRDATGTPRRGVSGPASSQAPSAGARVPSTRMNRACKNRPCTLGAPRLADDARAGQAVEGPAPSDLAHARMLAALLQVSARRSADQRRRRGCGVRWPNAAGSRGSLGGVDAVEGFGARPPLALRFGLARGRVADGTTWRGARPLGRQLALGAGQAE